MAVFSAERWESPIETLGDELFYTPARFGTWIDDSKRVNSAVFLHPSTGRDEGAGSILGKATALSLGGLEIGDMFDVVLVGEAWQRLHLTVGTIVEHYPMNQSGSKIWEPHDSFIWISVFELYKNKIKFENDEIPLKSVKRISLRSLSPELCTPPFPEQVDKLS